MEKQRERLLLSKTEHTLSSVLFKRCVLNIHQYFEKTSPLNWPLSAPLKLSFIPPTRSRDVITLWWGCRSWLSHLRVQIEETDGVKGKFFLVPNLHSFEVNWGLSHIRSLYLCSLIHTKQLQLYNVTLFFIWNSLLGVQFLNTSFFQG